MLYSKLFGKTVKNAPADSTFASHKLLYQAGFVRESVAGRYFFLPLGQIVQKKIMEIIKKEMDKTGAQEMLSPVLHPLELWQETNRTNTAGFELMKVTDRHGAEFALGGTAEEMFVDVIRKFQLSYRDLPINIYQFSNKFRDELRARGGLLRVREFIMKDAYSFHKDEEDFKKEYKKMKETYKKIFKRMDLETIIVESDNGYIGGEYCHEFVVPSEIGESSFYLSSDEEKGVHEDLAKKLSDKEKKEMSLKKGIEVGNVFQLGYHYSNLMKNASFIDQDGKVKPYYMGCYGIGIGRTLAAIVEMHNDEKGIIWPQSVAPYQIHLIGLNLDDDEVKKKAFSLYDLLTTTYNLEVLFDDRENVSPGEKFATADLIGIPIRLVVSKKTGDKIELKKRNEKESKLISIEELIKTNKS